MLLPLLKQGWYVMEKTTNSHIVIGIDQSYNDTGITIACNGKIKAVSSVPMKKLANNTERRNELANELLRYIEYAVTKSDHIEIIVERIRLMSAGVLSMDYIKSMGALIAVIVDTAAMYHIPVYSVDTRAWKTAIIGTAKEKQNKYGLDPKKWPTILWCIKNGYKDKIIDLDVGKRKKGIIEKNGIRYTYNDNKADSIGIALYGFVKGRKLMEEH